MERRMWKSTVRQRTLTRKTERSFWGGGGASVNHLDGRDNSQNRGEGSQLLKGRFRGGLQAALVKLLLKKKKR